MFHKSAQGEVGIEFASTLLVSHTGSISDNL
jgi:hypothetical protein